MKNPLRPRLSAASVTPSERWREAGAREGGVAAAAGLAVTRARWRGRLGRGWPRLPAASVTPSEIGEAGAREGGVVRRGRPLRERDGEAGAREGGHAAAGSEAASPRAKGTASQLRMMPFHTRKKGRRDGEAGCVDGGLGSAEDGDGEPSWGGRAHRF